MERKCRMDILEQAYAEVLEKMPEMRNVLEQDTGHLENAAANSSAGIKVVGIGGGGNDTINHMIAHEIEGVEYTFLSTDEKECDRSVASDTIHLRDENAQESREEILAALRGAGVVFVIAGMGGKTGTNLAPVVASCAQELGALTVGIVMKPFRLEGSKRRKCAEAGIAALREHADAVLVIVNDKLMNLVDEDETMKRAFHIIDVFLCAWLRGVTVRVAQAESQHASSEEL